MSQPYVDRSSHSYKLGALQVQAQFLCDAVDRYMRASNEEDEYRAAELSLVRVNDTTKAILADLRKDTERLIAGKEQPNV
jgi:hypothetical protein